MTVKLCVSELKKGTNEFNGIIIFNDEKYSFIIKNEQDRKQIELPYSIGRLVPLQNFTSIPRSVLQLLIKCNTSDSTINENLFVDRKSHFKKRTENEGNWLYSSNEPIQIFSDPIFDFFTNNLEKVTNIEIIPK